MDMRLVTHTKLQENGCLEWQGYIGKGGYGNIRVLGRMYRAHRYAYEQIKGPIPAGVLVCHHCDNRKCVNVEHLFLGSHSDNMLDMHSKDRHPKYTFSINGVHNRAKLTPSQVDEIRARYKEARRGLGRELALEYGVATSVISRIVNNKLWGSSHG